MKFDLRGLFGIARTSGPLTAAGLDRWAEELYRASVTEPPLPAAVFTIEQLELHARTLAASHQLGQRRGHDRLLKRLADSEQVIARCHDLMSWEHAAGRRLTPAAEWLLDNHYLIEEQVYLARRHFPRAYSRKLPRLSGGELAGVPRIYDLVTEFIAHVDGRVDNEALTRYAAAYQSVTPLTLGELWSVAIMLRLALVENLRRVATSITWQRAHRDRALAWAQRIDAPAQERETALLVLADMVRENPSLSTAFVTQFTQALQGRGTTTTLVLAWLEQRLAEQAQTIEEVVRAESQSQAADQASMANSIASLRLINATPWREFVEANSVTEKILRQDPAGVYDRMDFTTRDEYRHVVEKTARRLHLDEQTVAQTAVALAEKRYATQKADVAAHVGYLLVDEGIRHLERQLRGRQSARLCPRSVVRGLTLFAYLGPVALLSAGGVFWAVRQSFTAPELAWPVLALCAALAVSQCAVAVMNWLASVLKRPRTLPRMDFEYGIPEESRTMVVVPALLSSPQYTAGLVEGLELRYLANRDPNLWFGLLTDFADATAEHVEGDEELLALAGRGIEALNGKYGNGAHGRFFLFHRPRLYNRQEVCWMGRERKRGKIEDFNALLCGGDRQPFSRMWATQRSSPRFVTSSPWTPTPSCRGGPAGDWSALPPTR